MVRRTDAARGPQRKHCSLDSPGQSRDAGGSETQLGTERVAGAWRGVEWRDEGGSSGWLVDGGQQWWYSMIQCSVPSCNVGGRRPHPSRHLSLAAPRIGNIISAGSESEINRLHLIPNKMLCNGILLPVSACSMPSLQAPTSRPGVSSTWS